MTEFNFFLKQVKRLVLEKVLFLSIYSSYSKQTGMDPDAFEDT